MRRRKRSMAAVTVVLCTCVAASGCMDSEVRETLYLDPDGSVTWELFAWNIRSDSIDREEREEEERKFLSDFRRGWYADELFPAGASRVDHELVRKERPYIAMMTARYRGIDEVVQAIADREGESVEAWLEYLPDRTLLIVSEQVGEDALEDAGPRVRRSRHRH